MPPRPRSLRARRLSPKRPIRPRLEDLEIRLVLSAQEIIGAPTFVTFNPPGGTANLPHLGMVDGISGPLASSMTPAEMRAYYGVNNVSFGGIVGDGAGQTIAIVDAYDDPSMQDSVNGVVTGGDLYQFDKYFGLSDNINFTKYSETGSTTSLPAADPTGSWETEESLDVEWVHSIAPAANIDLVEATTASIDLYLAEQEAATLPGVAIVSNSWGAVEFPSEALLLEPYFTTPAGHAGGGVTYLASTGDDGSSGQDASNPFVSGEPSLLPNVVGVGGTSIYDNLGGPTVETAWNRGSGGESSYIPEPSFQEAVQSSGKREGPDVSMDADPDFGGVAIYDTYLTSSPWGQEGGTSLACPMWAGLVAIADQGRVAAGGQTLNGATQTLPALYSLPSADFNDILSGNNGPHGATVGYDMVTGLGSPRAASLIPDLAAYNMGQSLSVTAQPPTSVNAGSSFGLTVSVEDAFGNVDADYNGQVTLTLAGGPSGASLTPVTVTAVNGVAVFDNLAFSTVGGGYQFEATATVNNASASITSNTFAITSNSNTPTSITLYPATSLASLSAALNQAATDPATNITIILEAGTYTLSNSSPESLLIENLAANTPLKNIKIEGQGEAATVIVPSDPHGWGTSIFEVLGTTGHEVSVSIKGLTIEDGVATTGGVLGGNAAVGGGLLMDGGTVALSQVSFLHDAAIGREGSVGAAAKRKLAGGPGGAGGDARGGGLYVAGGTLSLIGVSFVGDATWGGLGGSGGIGGTDGGGGGNGGFGGSATGGGAFVAGGSVTGQSNVFQSDAAVGGSGGYGGHGGPFGTPSGLGRGGNGGDGGNAFGGGFFVGGGSVTLASTPITEDRVQGGRKGTGGMGGFSHLLEFNSSSSYSIPSVGRGGLPGLAGNAEGGGVFVGGGSLTLGSATGPTVAMTQDRAIGGDFDGLGYSGDSRYAVGAATSKGGNAARLRGRPGPPTPISKLPGGPNGGTQVNHGPPRDLRHHQAPGSSSSFGGGSSGQSVLQPGIGDGGAIYVSGGAVKLIDQNVSNDIANYGGGIFVSNGAVKATGIALNHDVAEIGGGVVNEGTLKIQGGTFLKDSANKSADGWNFGSFQVFGGRGATGAGIANYGKLGVSSVTGSSNVAKYGGAIYNSAGSINAANLTLKGNTAATRGGGIYSLKGSLTIVGGTIAHNRVNATGSSPSVAIGSGGGIDSVSGKASISGVSFTGNNARAGGAIYIGSGSATVTDSNFTDNVARQTGGAILADGSLTVEEGTLTGNTSTFAGGAIDSFGPLTMDSVTLTGNLANTDGGAINIESRAILDGDTISGNTAVVAGGGINIGGTATILATSISSNQASDGGGIYDVASLTMTNGDSVTQNVAKANGGGIYLGSGGRINATGLEITSNNVVNGDGGGIYDQRGALTITHGEIDNNNAPASAVKPSLGRGGGLYDTGGKVTLSNSPVESNSAVFGGGLYINTGSVSLDNQTVDANTATNAGGGLYSQGTLALTSATITLNVAQSQSGGGIEDLGKVTIVNSTLGQNTAAGSGGDLDITAVAVGTITQSTISTGHAQTGGDIANAGILSIGTSTIAFGSASSSGGGLENASSGSLTMANTTVADNTSVGNGGGIDSQNNLNMVNDTVAYNLLSGLGSGSGLDVESGTAVLSNTIVDLNTSTAGADLAGLLAATSSNNLFGIVSAPLPTGTPNLSGVSLPFLGPLASNGGPTQTIALLEVGGQYSPAIDAGSTALAIDPTTGKPLTTDQRGALRGTLGINAGNSVDIGAYEASSSYLVTSIVDSAILAGTLRSGVQWSGGSTNDNPANFKTPAPNTIVFDTTGAFGTPQTINLTSTLSVPDTPVGVEIEGPGGGVVSIKGNGFQVIDVSGGTAILQGITVSGGSATNGGGVGNAGNLTLNNVILSGNSASDGGAIYSSGTGSSLAITGGTIENNSAAAGAGLYSDTSLTVSNVSIFGNTASEVGGAIDMSNGGTLTVSGSTITENAASTNGGGLFLESVTATITGGSITGDTAILGGGLYSGGFSGSLTITGTSLTGNSASTGGAIDTDGPVALSLSAAMLSSNSASVGGAINSTSTTTITASTLANNSATGAGGAIENSGKLTVSASTLSGNTGGTGGAIDNIGTLTVGGSTLSSNSATFGGGIHDVNGAGDVVTNTTLADNAASTGGGAVYSSLSSLMLVNDTVAYNSVVSGGTGAGVDSANGTVTLDNTIVDLNTGTGATDVAGNIAGSNNILGTTGTGGPTNGTNGNDVAVARPGLASGLASNGGPTQTIALVAGSPAIDAGADTIGGVTVPSTDQRGALRGSSSNASYVYAGTKVDVGAYEASSAYVVTGATDSNDLGSLRTAVSWANTSLNVNPTYLALTTPAANTITFGGTFTTPQTVTLAQPLGSLVFSNTTTPVAVVGPGGGLVTISGGNAVGVFQVNKGVTASLTDLVISGGLASTGAGINNAGSLGITGSTIEANSAIGAGGGISNTGSLALASTTVSGNSSTGAGGGISNAGSLVLTTSTVSGNSAAVSGGGVSDPGTLTLTSSKIMGNSAPLGGGLAAAGTLTATGSTITGNSAGSAGGGLAIQAGGSATLTGASIVSDNSAGGVKTAGSGGGVDNSGTLTLSYSTITSNTSTGKGGGVDNESGGTFTSGYSTLSSNATTEFGGGGLDNSGTAILSTTTLSSNTATSNGGGINNEVGGVLNLTSSTLNANSGTSTGGGVANAGTATLSDATIAANESGRGGGVYDTGLLTTVDATIAYNSVGAGGTAGGLDAVGGTTALYNTIVALNTAGAGAASDAAGSLAPVSVYDLFGAGGSGGLTASTLNGIVSGVKKPDLGTLASNGGPTQSIALAAGSPAIDAAAATIPGVTVPAIDQRGAIRGAAGLNAGSNPDIGAYEASSSYLVTTTTDSTDMGTLRSAISWANLSTNANPQNLSPNATTPNTAVFNTSGSFASAQTITINPTLGPIQLSSTLASGEAIDGTASRGLTISGGGLSQVFSVAAGTTAKLSGVIVSGGWSATSGGAISNLGSLTVSDSTLEDNTAGAGGGAIDNMGNLMLQSSTLNANSATSYGGAIDVESAGRFTAENSTFADNTSGQGGGVYSTGALTAINDTIAYNVTTTATSGGGLNAAGGSSTLFNTIVASNSDSAGTDPADDIAGTVVAGSSYNLVGTGGSGGLTNGVNGNQVGVADPGLGTGLGPYGGPTNTIPLVAGSPAIAAAPPTADSQSISLDQRGALRGSLGTSNIDVGSFELSSDYVVTNAEDSTVPGTLRSAIAWANADTNSGLTTPLVITFDTTHLFATPQQIVIGLGTLALTNPTRPIVIDGPGASDVTISGNNAYGVLTIAAGVDATILGVTIADGNAAAGGGIVNAGTLTVGSAVLGGTTVTSGVSFNNNTTPSGSGAAIDNTGTLTVVSSGFFSNSGSYYGGAIFNDDGTATIANSDFVGNSTLYGLGGAIDNFGGTLTVTGGTFQGNTSFQGGAIYNRNDPTSQPGTTLTATATLNGTTITGNSAYQGGGVFNEGTLNVLDSAVVSNNAFQGGAISNNFSGTTTLTDSTLAENTAQQYGGAIDNVSTLTLVSDTVAYNVVGLGGAGGGIDAYAGTTAMYDTIAELNTVGTGTTAASNDISGQLTPGSSYNMVGNGSLLNGINNNIVGSLTPGLAAGLANNGGPTQTIALYTGSPAIGAGNASIAGVTIPLTDQRGVGRPVTGFDIGAFQGSIAAPVTPPTSTPTPTTVAVTAAIVTPSVSVMGPVSTTAAATTAPIVSGPSPFVGRKFAAKGHRQAKTGHHASQNLAAHKVDLSRKTVKVRVEKKTH